LGHLFGAQHDLVSIECFGAQEGRGSRTGNDKVLDSCEFFSDFASKMVGRESDFFLVPPLHREQRNAAERRIPELLAELDFLIVKTLEIVASRILNGGMKRSECLDDYFALDLAATRASGHLGKELERALARAKIGKMQRQVRIDDT